MSKNIGHAWRQYQRNMLQAGSFIGKVSPLLKENTPLHLDFRYQSIGRLVKNAMFFYDQAQRWQQYIRTHTRET